MKNLVEYLFFQLLIFIIRLIPKGLLPFTGKCLGLLLFYLGVRRRVVEKNLSIAFGPETDKTDRTRLAKKTYENSGIVLIEVLMLKSISPARLHEFIEIEGLDTLQSAINEGKGVVIAGNHFGNWELISAAISTMGAPINVYAGKQRNELFDDGLNDIRRKFGTNIISKSKTATIEMMKVLKNNRVLGMAGDLNVPHNKLFVDFFGRKAAVGRGLGSFTLNKNCPLIFIWCIRVKGLKHKGYLKRIDYQVTGDKNLDLTTISQAITSELEQRIREYPDQYFWLNKRWKTRPDNDTEPVIY